MHIKKQEKFLTQEKAAEKVRQSFILAAALLVMISSLWKMGFSMPSFLLDLVWQKQGDISEDLSLLKQGFYLMTDIKWGEPMSLITSVMPGIRQTDRVDEPLAQVKGYFNQDENSYLTKEEAAADEKDQPLAVPSPKDLEFPDLSNLGDVYTHYFSASGEMDFDLDMLEEWQFNELAAKKLSIAPAQSGPQILIFHTHAREDYIGGQTVVDIGEALKKELEENYGVRVLHVTDEFYEPSNHTKFVTQGEYERMEPVIEKVLQDNPSISVVLDIHRDGVKQDVHLVTEVSGRPAAKIMFVNGLCLNRNLEGKVEHKEGLPNPYVGDNLAFSLQSTMMMNVLYPGLSRKIYLNEWRYSTHMKPQSLLIEWGADTNTGEEAMNAVQPMAKVLMSVLGKD